MKIFGRVFLTLRKNLMLYTWWEIVIFVIGAVSFVSILIVLFLPVGSGPSKFTFSGMVPAVSDLEFGKMLADSLNLPRKYSDQPITILNNGDAFMKSLLADIDQATSSINIMDYIWQDGAMSDQILEHLDQKLKQGVPVRIMYDAYGVKVGAPKKQFKIFTDLGGKVSVFHSLTIMPWRLGQNQARDHRRAFVIDGKIGYVGGIGINDSWLGTANNPKEYRDTMFRVQGPMARDVQAAFGELWTSMTGEILSGADYYPPDVAKTSGSAFTYIPLASTPSAATLILPKFFLLSVLGAKHSIDITTPYFLPDLALRQALIAKVKEGVNVRILVPNDFNDSQSVYYASHYSYQELLEGGVKIYEYQPTFSHTKSMVIDGVWSVIGSANLDNHSREHNEENVFGIADQTFASQMAGIFENDLSKSKPVDLTQWNKRGIWQRIREDVSRTLFEQY